MRNDVPPSTMADAGGARAGDPLSWARLDERLRPWLRGILATHSLPLGYTADDIVSLTFAHVYRGISHFRVESGSSFRAWVLAIMLNQLATLVRMAKARKRGPDRSVPLDRIDGSSAGTPQIADAEAEPASMLARHRELVHDFGAAIAGLDAETRLILELRVLNELPFDAIARRIGRDKPDTVRVIFNRAMERVRERMRRHAD